MASRPTALQRSRAALALYHAVVFGDPITVPYDFSTQRNLARGFFMGLGVPDATALWHILLSPYRPLLLVALARALGIGKVATPEQAQEVHAFIRSRIAAKHGQAVADALRVL